jgi:hypothetical protein
MNRLADNFRSQVLMDYWKLAIHSEKVNRLKINIATNYRDKKHRHLLLSKSIQAFKSYTIHRKVKARKDLKLNSMAEHLLYSRYYPKLLALALNRLHTAPKITKSIRFRRFNLKRKSLCGLLMNKLHN